MAHFEYNAFRCDMDELQPELTKLGLEGWRLHTCDPVVVVGPQGSGMLTAFVVMDKFIDDEEVGDTQVEDDDAQEGIAMRG